MAFSTISSTFGNFATATTGAANFLPNYFQPDAFGVTLDTANEVYLSNLIANYITLTFIVEYGQAYDLRDSACTSTAYLNTISSLSNYDNGVIYSKGHREPKSCTDSNKHVGVVMNNSNTLVTVWDHDIYSVTSSKIVNAFIWHCETAIPERGSDGCDCYGLSAAFTHNTTIPYWGTTGNQVYLGWTNEVPKTEYPLPLGGSPQYEWLLGHGAGVSDKYGDIPLLYYYFACTLGYSSVDALVALGYVLYSQSYQDTPLGGWLEIYGNRNVGLP